MKNKILILFVVLLSCCSSKSEDEYKLNEYIGKPLGDFIDHYYDTTRSITYGKAIIERVIPLSSEKELIIIGKMHKVDFNIVCNNMMKDLLLKYPPDSSRYYNVITSFYALFKNSIDKCIIKKIWVYDKISHTELYAPYKWDFDLKIKKIIEYSSD